MRTPSDGDRRRYLIAVIGLAAVIVLVVAVTFARRWLGIELSIGSVEAAVRDLGWKGWAIFLALMTFRPLLALPSWMLLTAGGLAFGALTGTLLGAAGITLASTLCFVAARLGSRAWVVRNDASRVERFRRAVARAGAPLVALVTAHPAGPMTGFDLAAGLSRMAFASFLLAVVTGALTRAALVCWFGASLGDWGSARSLLATALLVGVTVLPLAHTGLRRRIFAHLE